MYLLTALFEHRIYLVWFEEITNLLKKYDFEQKNYKFFFCYEKYNNVPIMFEILEIMILLSFFQVIKKY